MSSALCDHLYTIYCHQTSLVFVPSEKPNLGTTNYPMENCCSVKFSRRVAESLCPGLFRLIIAPIKLSKDCLGSCFYLQFPQFKIVIRWWHFWQRNPLSRQLYYVGTSKFHSWSDWGHKRTVLLLNFTRTRMVSLHTIRFWGITLQNLFMFKLYISKRWLATVNYIRWYRATPQYCSTLYSQLGVLGNAQRYINAPVGAPGTLAYI